MCDRLAAFDALEGRCCPGVCHRGCGPGHYSRRAGGASAQTGAERITSYDTGIAIQRDGSILVTEQIVYNFGSNQRHGIIREIPVRFRYNGSYDRIYRIDVRSVRSYAPRPVHSREQRLVCEHQNRQPGPDRLTGVHWYQITYLVRGSLNAFADHDELYWNVVGNQWNVPIGQARVRVSALAAVSRAACFAGPLGSAAACGHAAITNGVANFSQNGLGPREGLTVVVAIPRGVAASPGPILQERWSVQRAFALTPVSAGASGGLLAVLAVLVALVLVKGRDRRYAGSAARIVDGTPVQADEAVPLSSHDEPAMESAPPAGVRPGQAGTLLDGAANPRDVTGTIVDLAVRGYLRIEDAPPGQTHRDWRLVRLDKTGGLLDYEQILLDGLFKDASWDSGRSLNAAVRTRPRLRRASSGRPKMLSMPTRPTEAGSPAAPTGPAAGGSSSAACCWPPGRWRVLRGGRPQPPRAHTGPGGPGRIGADLLCPADAGAHGEGNRPGPPAAWIPQVPHDRGRADPPRRSS